MTFLNVGTDFHNQNRQELSETTLTEMITCAKKIFLGIL